MEDEALVEKRVDDLDGQDRASELTQKLESDRRLRDSIERWAPLVLADAILAQAISLEQAPAVNASRRGRTVLQADPRSLRRAASAARRNGNALAGRSDREGQGVPTS